MSPFVQVAWPAATGIEFGTPVFTSTSKFTSTTTNVNIPSGLNGKLCLIILRPGRSPVYIDPPSGWNSSIYPSTNTPPVVLWRLCDGTEGSTITVGHYSDAGLTTGTTSSITAIAWPVTGVATSESSYLEVAWEFSDNPPSLTPSWGSAENEWLTLYTSRYADWTVASYPTNYTELEFYANTNGTDVDYTALAVGRRLLTATTEDPGAYTITAGANGLSTNRAMTLALRPA